VSFTTVNGVDNLSGTDAHVLGVNPQHVGDLLILTTDSAAGGGAITGASGVSGGGVTTWNQGTSYNDTFRNAYIDAWWGVVTATGASNITVTGFTAGAFNGLWSQEFADPLHLFSLIAATPAAGSSGTSSGSGTAVTYPSLLCAGATDYLYIGRAFSIFGNMNAGSTPGFTYTGPGSSQRQVAYNLAAAGTQGCAATQTNTGSYDVAAMIIGSGPPPATGGTGNQQQSGRSMMRKRLLYADL
jgi:hypothetical protein